MRIIITIKKRFRRMTYFLCSKLNGVCVCARGYAVMMQNVSINLIRNQYHRLFTFATDKNHSRSPRRLTITHIQCFPTPILGWQEHPVLLFGDTWPCTGAWMGSSSWCSAQWIRSEPCRSGMGVSMHTGSETVEENHMEYKGESMKDLFGRVICFCTLLFFK